MKKRQKPVPPKSMLKINTHTAPLDAQKKEEDVMEYVDAQGRRHIVWLDHSRCRLLR